MSIFDRAICGDEGLADDLTAEDALGALLRAAAAEEIEFDFFEIEKIEKGFEGCRQWGLRCSTRAGSVPDSGSNLRGRQIGEFGPKLTD